MRTHFEVWITVAFSFALVIATQIVTLAMVEIIFTCEVCGHETALHNIGPHLRWHASRGECYWQR